MPTRFAVMGNPIAHSLSPDIHQAFAKQMGISLFYDKMDIPLAQFEARVRAFFNEGGMGLNITQPFKERAFAMSEDVSIRGKQARSVNTLWMRDGLLCADNTDGIGFLRDVARHATLAGKRIILLGAGGALRGILGPLISEAPLSVTVVNRDAVKLGILLRDFPGIRGCLWQNLALLAEKESYDVVINATSADVLGDALVLPESLIANQPFCYDLSYGATTFVAKARALGLTVTDGLGMLVEQAAEAFSIWHGLMPETMRVLALMKKGTNDIGGSDGIVVS